MKATCFVGDDGLGLGPIPEDEGSQERSGGEFALSGDELVLVGDGLGDRSKNGHN